jgi:malonate-semialdehyde dehydrogenase (acetylating) / methylmalonate-semialdehyde dehydrogenase
VEVLEYFVGGSRVAVETEETLEVPDPATGELLGQVPLSSTADVDRAVECTPPGVTVWSATPRGKSL